MSKRIIRYIVLLTLTMVCTMVQAQFTSSEVKEQLEQRQIDPEELERRLLAKGIDVNQINNLSPTEIQDLEKVVAETIAEIEADRITTQGLADESISESANTVRTGLDTIVPDSSLILTSIDSNIQNSIDSPVVNLDDRNLIYGQHLFRSRAIPVFDDSKQILVNDAYRLGSGDDLSISIYGASQFEGQFVIDKSGYIYPNRLPRIYLKGMALGEAREKLEKVFQNYYRFSNGEFNVSVSATRNVTIGVFGNAENIGSYALPALNTAFNAISAAGGPSEIGSVRKIRLHRGEEIKYIDVYAFMSDPSISQDYYLEDNDIIQIPEAERLIQITGEVRRPFIFELLPDEHLIDALRYAGGVTDKAYTDNIQIKRKTGDAYRIHDVNLTDILNRNGDYSLEAGDEITIRPIRGQLKDVVFLEGKVNYPGQFDLYEGMTLVDLINKGMLRPESRKDIAILYRLNSDSTYNVIQVDLAQALDNPKHETNIQLQEGDRLQIFTANNFKNNFTISVEGNVRNPGSFPLDNGGTLYVSDAILLADGLYPNVYEKGMILRSPIDNPLQKSWVSFNVINAINDRNSIDNILLEPNDKVFIYSAENFSEPYKLVSNGSVRNPAIVPYGKGVRISDLIILSDGLASDASDKGYVVRYNLKNKNEEFYIPVNIDEAVSNPGGDADILLDPGDRLFIFSTTQLSDKFFVNISGEVRNPGEYIYSPTMSLKSILLLAGGLKFTAATNRVEIFRLIFENNQPVKKSLETVQLDQDLNIIGRDDIKLQPFDIVVVRRIPGFELHERVYLEGQVTYPGVYSLLNDNERITDLIERCGGFTKEAFLPAAKLYRSEDDKGYVVIRLDEIMRNRNSVMNIRLKHGDRIIVPKSEELVVIRGAVDLESAVLDDIAKTGKVNVAFIGRKRAMHYINQFTGGLSADTNKKYIKVKYPNGAINRTKQFLFFNTTPRVEAGSEIIIDEKPKELVSAEEEKEKEKVDWGKVVANSIAQAGAILSLILLIQQVD